MANTPSKPLPSKYEIAMPESYAALDLSAARVPTTEVPQVVAIESALKATAERKLPGQKDIATSRDLWSRAEKDAPKVKERDKDKFEAPDEDSGGLAGPTVERFAGPSKVIDEAPREKRAVWVVHGMGQQIPFETLDSLATGLLDVLPNPEQIKPRFRTVKIADQVLQRVELDVDEIKTNNDGKPPKKYELHLYETYWAPKTEGVANLTDVTSFLWDGGLRGILNWVKSFKRAMFGGMATFSIRWLTPFWLCLALLIFGGIDGDQRGDFGRWRRAIRPCFAGIFEVALAATYRVGQSHGRGGLQFWRGVVCRRTWQTARAVHARKDFGGRFLLDGDDLYHPQYFGHCGCNDGHLACGLDQQLRSIRDTASCRSCLRDKRTFSGRDRKRTELRGVLL